MAAVPTRSAVALGTIAVVVLLSAFVGADPVSVGDGTANVSVLSPATDELSVADGRFGTAAEYVRVPDLVVDVRNLSGRPRLVYRVSVPGVDLDRGGTRLLQDEGRVVVHVPDRAYPPRTYGGEALPPPGTYEGRLAVRIQSFETDRAIVNRTVRVRVPA